MKRTTGACSAWDVSAFISRTGRAAAGWRRVFRVMVLFFFLCGAAGAQTGDWGWMGGSNVVSDPEVSYAGTAGGCGPKGVAAPGNNPGSRRYSARWTDAKGHFWLFGGDGWDCVGIHGYLNDLWEFDSATDEWTWVSGSSSVGMSATGVRGRPGVYGKLGVAAPGNVPGGRQYAAAWSDKSGHLWLFGGDGMDGSSAGNLNDL